ncbi:glyoxylase-like metal-dependent hydrolase (beta-lactamase superfamily II) [Flavimobilis soli]|uniref:Glyoxylase-like metal-dependent hydrolase (Beta-lactamase superfamily II) n=1 Tax=Flavimobilis soli TaxID=442709 RepID=A0A2A9EA07_9MICO|nr:MBL fold metallo-hydrolase [Flavimobilis soli]PFG35664.1 glyoxylase-like metal-dependent hydrolase (beta-lactamase superfamily II) [Flavimobilis soli]
MHVETIVAPVFGTNSYLVSATGSGPCVIIDAGGGVVPALTEHVRVAGLAPVAVLATHGHVDHTWSAAELCELYDVPLLIHADDAYRLSDPFGTIEDSASHAASGPLAQALAAGGCNPVDYRAPQRVQPFVGARTDLDLLGVPALTAWHAPGHTQGATVFLALDVPALGSALPERGDAYVDGADATAFTGDVLFAGTIGRTDLPGGDMSTMRRSLAALLDGLPERALVLPGHGPASRLDAETVRNPYLARR